jgi:hypothetical protein
VIGCWKLCKKYVYSCARNGSMFVHKFLFSIMYQECYALDQVCVVLFHIVCLKMCSHCFVRLHRHFMRFVHNFRLTRSLYLGLHSIVYNICLLNVYFKACSRFLCLFWYYVVVLELWV